MCDDVIAIITGCTQVHPIQTLRAIFLLRYQHWSEGSLIMSENIVRAHFNASVPNWMRPAVAESVIFNRNYKETQGPMER